MPRARKSIIDLSATPYYHCVARCVRRAFLCGECEFSGKNYEHRREWIVARLQHLSAVFSIEIASYAVMHNHYHLVLRVDPQKAANWSENEIIIRWSKMCQLPEVVKRYQQSSSSLGVDDVAQPMIELWRARLTDISWFMRFLNEHLARKANEEDRCTGRFWEGRFKSQPLLDEAAVLTAMSYVDLNPVRAGLAKNIQTSDFTSAQQRLENFDRKPRSHSVSLMALSASSQQRHPNSFGFTTDDYLQLVDWAGRAILPNKRSAIPTDEPKILHQLNINPEGFVQLMQTKDDLSRITAMGSTTALTHFIQHMGQKFIKGLSLNQKIFT